MEKDATIEILRSSLSPNVYVGHFTHISDSEILQGSKVYMNCWIIKTRMDIRTFAGDGTKLDNCILDSFSRAGKYNHLFHVKLGRHTYTGQDTIIMHTHVGAFTSISWGVTIGASEHDFNRLTSHTFLYNPYDDLNNGIIYYDRFEKPTKVGNDVWIGANVTILRGVTIGDGAVIGANSMVTKDVPPYAIVVGNPARIIKFRFKEDLILKLLELKWWELEDHVIKDNCSLFASIPSDYLIDKLKEIRANQKNKLK